MSDTLHLRVYVIEGGKGKSGVRVSTNEHGDTRTNDQGCADFEQTLPKTAIYVDGQPVFSDFTSVLADKKTYNGIFKYYL